MNAPGAPETPVAGGSVDADESAPDVDPPDPAREGAPTEIVLLALVAVVVGSAARFVARTPLWLDEALSVNIASLSPGEINDALRHDGHPPLYYYLLHYWMRVAGSSDVAVRALSGAISVATFPLAWLAGRRRGGSLLGWTMVAVLSVSTFAVRYGTETRMYSLVILLVLAGYLLLDDLVRQELVSWPRVVGLGMISGMLLLSHYWSMFLIAGVSITLLWRHWRTRNRGTLLALAAIVVGSVVLFLPWLPWFAYQAGHTGTPWASPTRPSTTVAVTLQDFHTATSDFKDPVLAIAFTSVLVLLGVFGAAVSSKRIELDLRTVIQVRYEGAVIVITLGLGMVAGLATRSAFASRYTAVIFPLFILVAAAGITRFASRPVRFGVLACYLALSLLGVVQVVLVYQRSQAAVIAEAVAASAQPGDLVVYCPDQLGPAAQREMRSDLRHVAYPTLKSPELVDWVDYESRNAGSDPAALAKQVSALAGPEHSIYVVWAGSYKTFEGKCEAFMHELSQLRPEIEDLVTGDAEKYFEHANLKQFKPAPPR